MIYMDINGFYRRHRPKAIFTLKTYKIGALLMAVAVGMPYFWREPHESDDGSQPETDASIYIYILRIFALFYMSLNYPFVCWVNLPRWFLLPELIWIDMD